MADTWLRFLATFALGTGLCVSCSAGGDGSKTNGSGGSGTTGPGAAGSLSLVGGGGTMSLGGIDTGGSSGGGDDDNPTTCTQAEAKRTYIGCDFWPTVTFNPVYSEFDFAVVIANSGTSDAKIDVSGPAGFTATDTVPAGALKAITLPWVKDLKGAEFSRLNTSEGRAKDSVRVDGGAYHVTSSIPVTAWQFSPLQYSKPKADFAAGCATTWTSGSPGACCSRRRINGRSTPPPTSATATSAT